MLSVTFSKKTLLSLIYLLILLALIGCSSKPARFGVIFMDGIVDIYQIPDNTQSKVEQLTFSPTIGEYQLLVSNNGDRIIFETGSTFSGEEPSEATKEQLGHIYLLDITSNILIDITSVLIKYDVVWQGFSMDWSPDQSQFVVITHDGVGSEINSILDFVDFDGENKNSVLVKTTGDIPSVINSVKWSPDGKKLLLTQGVIGNEQQLQNPGNAILVYDLEKGDVIQIANYKDQCFPEEWSPTSQHVVATCSFSVPYVEGISGPSTVRIFNVNNPDQPYEHIAFTPCYDPSWSPNGKQIALVCDKDEDHKGLFVVSSDGSSFQEINLGDLGNPVVLKTPIWSPDGSQIVYTAGNEINSQNIYSIQLNNSNNHALTNKNGYYQIIKIYPLP